MKEIEEKVNYCLNCKIKPCSLKGCPLNNNIPEFIKAVKEEKYKEAYQILSETTVLPGVCGKICPHMKQCQGSCVRGIKGEPVSIGDIESFIFQKRHLLYGLSTAKKYSDNGIIACEGYMDVASMQTAGFKNTVASLGTALTKDQLLLIRAYTNTLYLCYDNDDAGHKATARAIKIAKTLDFNIKVMVMTEYKDPDEYIKADKKKMQELIDNAINAKEWLVNYYVESNKIDDLINLMA